MYPAYTTLPSPGISLKTTGGILDLFVLVGDSPADVIALYTSIVGRPAMPPFWALGFQICRYGYRNLTQVKEVIDRTLAYQVPFDVAYIDIDYMQEYRDFTYDHTNFAGLVEYMNETKTNNNIRWTFIIDITILGNGTGYEVWDKGYKQDVFIKWPKEIPLANRDYNGNAPTDKDYIYGSVWPKGPSAFPDFLKNVTVDWWVEEIKKFYELLPFDGMWIVSFVII